MRCASTSAWMASAWSRAAWYAPKPASGRRSTALRRGRRRSSSDGWRLWMQVCKPRKILLSELIPQGIHKCFSVREESERK
uniref:Uncharacterized protein n=1 Tax=Arundo donax TaxID=35708 RepID=A0A0A9FKL1_ARUDO